MVIILLGIHNSAESKIAFVIFVVRSLTLLEEIRESQSTLTRYHCPIIGFFNIPKISQKNSKRKIWLYDRGDYDKFKQYYRMLTGILLFLLVMSMILRQI
jgi:hypothetical protein